MLRSRLALFGLSLVLAVSAAVGLSSPEPSYGVAGLKALVREADALADRLPAKPLVQSREDMILWAIEILPYMPYEGVTSGSVAELPLDVLLFWRLDSAAFHLAGQAACRSLEGPIQGPIFLNGRYTNPVSARFGNELALVTLVHELVHMQGGPFCQGKSADLEADTSIATLEVLAAMVNHGNLAALRPLLLELRVMGLSALQAELSVDEYRKFLASVSDDPFELSRFDKSARFWAEDPATLRDILQKYNVVPMQAIFEALTDGTVERIDFAGDEVFKIDDLVYFLDHADELVEAARGRLG